MVGVAQRQLNIVVFSQPWFVEELRELGHRVVSVGRFNRKVYDIYLDKVITSVDEVWKQLPSGFTPDCLVYHDDSWPIAVYGLEDLNLPKVFYSVDAHHHWRWHSHFGALFDLVLVALRDYVDKFTQLSPRVEWFPLWAPIALTPEPVKTIDVCFRGNLNPELHPKRVKFFDDLKKLVVVDVKQGPYVKDYPRSKIIINEAVKDDVNFRIFEALASGALLITPAIGNGLTELFAPGEEIILYEKGNVHDASEKIKYYLAHEEERAQIAERGYAKVLARHSSQRRAADLVRHIEALDCGVRPTQHLSAAYTNTYVGTMLAGANERVGAAKVLRQAIANLQQSMDKSEMLLENWQMVCLALEQELLKLGLNEDARHLAQQLRERFLGDEVIALGLINVYQKQNDAQAALALAQVVSPNNPQALLDAAPQLVQRVLS